MAKGTGFCSDLQSVGASNSPASPVGLKIFQIPFMTTSIMARVAASVNKIPTNENGVQLNGKKCQIGGGMIRDVSTVLTKVDFRELNRDSSFSFTNNGLYEFQAFWDAPKKCQNFSNSSRRTGATLRTPNGIASNADAPSEWKSPTGLRDLTGSIQTRYGCEAMNRLYHLKKRMCVNTQE